jgi:hypothetical protein
MALIPTEEAQVLRSYQVLTRQCAEERHALSGSVAVISQAEVDNCGDMATYFCLAECLQRANAHVSLAQWLPACNGMISSKSTTFPRLCARTDVLCMRGSGFCKCNRLHVSLVPVLGIRSHG